MARIRLSGGIVLAGAQAGVAAARLDETLADAAGRHLVVPAAWTSPRGWPTFWGRAHRVTQQVCRASSLPL